MKKALVKNKINYATFMFIPEGQSTVKSYRMPAWFPKFFTISIILLILTSGICFYSLSALKLQYDASRKEITKLAAINTSQKIEIENLQKSSEEVQKQLAENFRMLDEVKKAVGITPSPSNEGIEVKLVSPKDSSSISLLKEESNPDMSLKIASIEADFASLTDKIAAQKQIINDSMTPIKDQLAYLMAKPSIKPVTASITAGFGYRKNPFTSRGTEFHKGIDFAASYGQTVSATGDGIVTFAGWNAGYGRTVIISHGYGLSTLYGHNSKLLVKQGDKVKKGQAISKAGNTGRSTGTHVHYEVKLNGKNVNPTKYFD
ncbi:MAG: M23 family metallopeptidase [Clostridiaceae bacterium]|nr:M23 family metallopeptidase [Clostridiaceae bacterium]